MITVAQQDCSNHSLSSTSINRYQRSIKKEIPLKSMRIGRKPSVPERLAPPHGSEPGLNSHKGHNFVSGFDRSVVAVAGEAVIPENFNRSGDAVGAGRAPEGSEKSEEENEEGEGEEEA